jgi:hypothetical protein
MAAHPFAASQFFSGNRASGCLSWGAWQAKN